MALTSTTLTSHAQAAVIGQGATLPFITQQAETAVTNGSLIGPSHKFTTHEAEASGRKAIRLQGQGKFVEFTLTKPANSLVLRYSIPDNAEGTGTDASLSLYVNGAHHKDLSLTSKYAYYYGGYPYTNNPGAGNPHHFYDDTRTLLPDLPAGTKIRVQVDSGDTAPWYVVDLADFEQVAPPKGRPANSLSVTEYGADATGATEASGAFDAAIAAARSQGKEVWVPPGTFKITRHVVVDNITIRGAGMWHTTLSGKDIGLYGKWAPEQSRNVKLYDFSILGDTRERIDELQVNGIGGTMGGGSVISGVWIEHTKVAMWFDGPFDGLTITGTRMRNVTADGLNFRKGISNAVVENSHIRNSGDDGLAMWSHEQADVGNAFRFNTVELPILANAIAIYGGKDITVSDNLILDTLTQGGGLHVGNRFTAVPVSGTFTLARNKLVRAGVLDPNWQFGVGALWFYALDSAMTATINVTDTEILDSPYEAIQFIGNGQITGVNLRDVKVDGTGTFLVQLQSTGSATFTNVAASRIGRQSVYNCQGPNAFPITGSGNTGWSVTDVYCGPWPDPVQPGDASLVVAPSSVDFGELRVGEISPAKQVSLRNTGGSAAPIQSISAGGDFSQTNNCGNSLGAGAECQIAVTFRPSSGGQRSGSLAINALGSRSVGLSGVGADANLARGRSVSVSSALGGFPAVNLNDGNANSYWESNNNVFPQSATVDLGSARQTGRVVLKLPPATAWERRTQTLSIEGSVDGNTWNTLSGSAGHVFDPAAGNAKTIAFGAATVRYLRVTVTGNTGWPAAQLSEFEAYDS